MRNVRRAACAIWLAALLVYSAARGERNDVGVVQEDDLVTVRDLARIQPGTACEALDAFGARCALLSFNRFARFELRDRADQLDARALAIGALFIGGVGDDQLTGGASPDRFESHRRDGRDTMAGGGPLPLVDAGYFPGDDEVSYPRSRSVSVRLDGRPNDGERGEQDNVLDIEGVWTGGGADRLVGGDRRSPRRDIPIGSADRLEGGAGPDVVDGQGGRDLLIGGSGRDQLDGGRGRDRIRSADPDRDWVLCGRGLDRLAASASDVLMRM